MENDSWDWAVTGFEKSFDFRWKIKNIQLSGSQILLSPEQRCYHEPGRTWRLQLETGCGGSNSIALRLGLVASASVPVLASYKFMCAYKSDGSIYINSNTEFFELNSYKGFENMFRPQYSNSLDKFITNGHLTIHCTVDVLTCDIILPTFVPECILQADFSSLLDTGHFDVTLVAGEKEFRAHKLILSGRSPVFAQMFEVDMKEKSTNKIEIEDIEAETLQKMLLNIYSGDTPLLNTAADQLIMAKLRGKDESEAVSPPPADPCEEAKKLLYAADKYQIEGLVKCCEMFLSEHLTVDNVAETVLLADKHNATQLRKSCISFIVEHRSAVSETSSWSQVLAMNEILQDIYQATVEKYEAPPTAKRLKR